MRVPAPADPLRPSRPPPPQPAARRPVHPQSSSPPGTQPLPRGYRRTRYHRSEFDGFIALSQGRRCDGYSRRELEHRPEDGRDGGPGNVTRQPQRGPPVPSVPHVRLINPVRVHVATHATARGLRERHPHPREGRSAAQRPPQLRVDEGESRAGCAQR